jgi:signal transduction histidine kinase
MQSSAVGAEVSRHKCLIYDGEPSEQLPVVVPLLVDGLHDNWRCLYLGSPDAVRMIDAALSEKGVDTSREAGRGALVLSSERDHLRGGRFEPQAMVDGLCAAIDTALKDGFQGLCATGDMRWELGDDDENLDGLLEYEARLERVFRDRPLRGICQYHRSLLPPRAVRDALLTHGAAFFGHSLNRDNLFYTPPEILLGGADPWKHGEWMYRQILRVMDAERERDALLRDLERRVAERTAELQVANRHLEAFSYSVSHDLRAPLRAIAGFSAALAEDCGDRLGDVGHEHLENILEGVRRMGDLIDGMLALGRVVRAELRREPIDLSAMARDVARELRHDDASRPLELRIEPDLRAVGDPVLLHAVMTNLLGNALKFTSARPRPCIQVGRHGDEAGCPIFFVRDNGAGFDMRYAGKLFGPFQRLHRQDEFPGTGVGLATVERIIARHGGRIWAESSPGRGATFFFTLPGDVAPAEAPPAAD